LQPGKLVLSRGRQFRGARRIAPQHVTFAVFAHDLRIPTKPAMHSKMKPATCSDPKPAGVPI
jgi:hypothetical protein